MIIKLLDIGGTGGTRSLDEQVATPGNALSSPINRLMN